MKKLLLVALLAMGATSFAGVEGTEDKVALPIVAKGEVIAEAANLVIESTTAGMHGDEMMFDFGKIVANGKDSEAIEGTFKIVRGDGTDFAKTATYDTFKVGFDEGATTTTTTTTISRTAGSVTLKYAIGFVAPDMTAKEATGTVTAIANAAKTTTPGTFTDNSQKVYVVLSHS